MRHLIEDCSLKEGNGPWKKVTREEFMSAESSAGFRSKFPGSLATGGFSYSHRDRSVEGKVDYRWSDDETPVTAPGT